MISTFAIHTRRMVVEYIHNFQIPYTYTNNKTHMIHNKVQS